MKSFGVLKSLGFSTKTEGETTPLSTPTKTTVPFVGGDEQKVELSNYGSGGKSHGKADVLDKAHGGSYKALTTNADSQKGEHDHKFQKVCFVFKAKSANKSNKKRQSQIDRNNNKILNTNPDKVQNIFSVDQDIRDIDNFINSVEYYEELGDCDEDNSDVLLQFTNLNFSLLKNFSLRSFNPLKFCSVEGEAKDEKSLCACCKDDTESLLETGVEIETKSVDSSNVLKDLEAADDACCSCCPCCGQTKGEQVTAQSAEDKLQAELEKAEETARGWVTSTDLAHFVLFTPKPSVLKDRAAQDKFAVELNSVKTLNHHNEFWGKHSRNKTVKLNFKRLGALDHEVAAYDLEEKEKHSTDNNVGPYAKTWEELSTLNHKPYERIYTEFTKSASAPQHSMIKALSTLDNMKILSNILEDMDVCYYDYDDLEAMFILHDEKKLKKITDCWDLFHYPIDKIRNYFGEEVGFFFGFTVHYTAWLLGLVTVAAIVQAYTYFELPYSSIVIALFSLSIIGWATLMMSYWKLVESKFGLDWGMLDFESKLKIRKSFQDQGDEADEDFQSKIDSWDHAVKQLRDPSRKSKPNRHRNSVMSIKAVKDPFERYWYSDIVESLYGGVKKVYSPVDINASDYIPVSPINQLYRKWLSCFVQVGLQALIVYSTTMVYVLQSYVQSNPQLTVHIPYFGVLTLSSYAKYIATGLNVVQSWLFVPIHDNIVDGCNEFENHRTQDDYDNSYILKQALFTFVNSYISFFYIAFIAGNEILVIFGYPTVDGCAGYDTCMQALMFNLNSVLIANFMAQNYSFFTPGLGLLRNYVSTFFLGVEANPANKLDEDNHLHDFADQYYRLQSYGKDVSMTEIIADAYLGFYKQFGFLMLFLPAYPLAALICFVANYVEMHGDMNSFANHLRTLPTGAQDIGAWEDCFKFLIILSIPINCAIVVFTMNSFDPFLGILMERFSIPITYFIQMKLLVFLTLQYLVFIIITIINNLVPTTLESIVIANDRKRVVMSNLFLMDSVKQLSKDEDKINDLEFEKGRLKDQVEKMLAKQCNRVTFQNVFLSLSNTSDDTPMTGDCSISLCYGNMRYTTPIQPIASQLSWNIDQSATGIFLSSDIDTTLQLSVQVTLGESLHVFDDIFLSAVLNAEGVLDIPSSAYDQITNLKFDVESLPLYGMDIDLID